MLQRLTRAAACIGVAWLASCPEVSAVWIEEGSTASHLVFGMASKRGGHGNFAFYGLRVSNCGGPYIREGAVWLVLRGVGNEVVHRIVYGEPPPGFVSEQGPKPLVPGCYAVTVDGTGSTTFDISATGAVTERPRSTTARQ